MPSTRITTAVTATIGALCVALAPGFAQPAWSAPSGCSASIEGSYSVKAVCGSGTGQYRVVGTCVTDTNQRRTFTYGPWKSPATWVSTANCPSGSPFAIAATWETR